MYFIKNLIYFLSEFPQTFSLYSPIHCRRPEPCSWNEFHRHSNKLLNWIEICLKRDIDIRHRHRYKRYRDEKFTEHRERPTKGCSTSPQPNFSGLYKCRVAIVTPTERTYFNSNEWMKNLYFKWDFIHCSPRSFPYHKIN